MLRLNISGECRLRVKFGADGWVNLLDRNRLQVCRFALRPLTGDLFNLVVPLVIDP